MIRIGGSYKTPMGTRASKGFTLYGLGIPEPEICVENTKIFQHSKSTFLHTNIVTHLTS